MAYPSIARWLQYSGSRTPPRAFDPASDTITYIASIPGATRAFLRLYDSAGRYMYSRECTATGSDSWTWTADYQSTGNNHILQLVFAGTITGGSWQLNWNGVNTANIGYNDTPERRAVIIGNHPDIGPGNVQCTWNATTKTMTIEFISGRAHTKPDNRWAVGANNLSGTGPGPNGKPTITPTTQQFGVGDFPGRQGQHTWDMVGLNSDGWSGGIGGWNPREGLGPAKAGLWLDMAAGLTSISPANGATIATPTPVLSWDYSSGTILGVPVTTERNDIYDSDGVLLYSFNGEGRGIPLSVGLRTGQTYTWVLTVIKQSGQTTTSTQTFTVTLTRPAKLTATSNVYTDGHKIGVNWTAGAGVASGNTFVAYVIKVRPAGAAEDSPQNVEVWSSTSSSRGYAYVLRFPRNRQFILSFYVRQLQFGSEIDSLPHEITYTVALDSLIVLNPLNHDYVLLRLHEGRGYGPQGDPEYTPIWGQPYPLYDPPTDTGVVLSASVVEEFSYTPVIYPKLYAWYVNAQLTSYIVSDAMGNVWDMAVNRPYQRIPGGRRPLEIDCGFQQVGSNHFGELS